jgi:putative ABC transport system permease protein
MMLFRLLSLPYLRKHMFRWALTIAGIVLGVAVFVAMHTANQSVIAAFNKTVDEIAGKTQLQVTSGEFGFEESVLERVQSLPEVEVAVPVIEALAETGLRDQGNILILGIDMTGDRSLRDYELESGDEAIIDDPLVFLAQPDSLMVTRDFARRNGLDGNSKVPLNTLEGSKQFTVRGIMTSGGMSSAFGGNLAVMDIYAAQQMFGRGRRFDRIDLRLREGMTLDAGRARIQSALGPGFEVEPPSARGQHLESLLQTYSLGTSISSLFAMIIGMFIIYNSFSIAITQRRPEIGILRALGATRSQIRRLFLLESLIAGLLGSLLGVVFGMGLATLVARYFGRMIEQLLGATQRVQELTVDPTILVLALVLGVGTSIIAAWIPARSAAGVDPVRALQKGKYQVLSEGENRVRRRLALGCAVAAAVCLFFSRSKPAFYTGYVLMVAAGLLFAPALSLWLSKVIRPILKTLLPAEGTLAADSLIQAPRRTSATVSALMLSLAMVVGFGGFSTSTYESLDEWMTNALNPDFFVTPSANLTIRSITIPSSVETTLEHVEGVEQVQLVRSARVIYHGVPILVVSVEADKLAQKVHRVPLAGDIDDMNRRVAEGTAVMASGNFAELQHVALGDIVELPTPSGILKLPVAGIVRDHSDLMGTLFIDRAVYKKWWNDDTVNLARVYVRPGLNQDEVRRRIIASLPPNQRLLVLTNADVRKWVLQITDQWLAMTYNQMFVAVLVAILGIVNTLTVSITDRRRELGLLQAVGGLRWQIRRTVWAEALSIAAVGLVLGIGLGAVNLYYTLGMVKRDVGGLDLDYIFPVQLMLVMAPIILAAAFIAAIGPAEAAVRASLVEALEYE